MRISKHNLDELESLILTLDNILFCQSALCKLEVDKVQLHFDAFFDFTCSNVDCMQHMVSELQILYDCIVNDVKFCS